MTEISASTSCRGTAGDGPFLAVSGVEKAFGRQQVLRGVDLEVPRGLTTVVLGPSGGGKSVLLKHMLGLMEPDAGAVRVEGEVVTGLDERRIGPIRRKIGMLFQNGALFDSLTVRENIIFPLRELGEQDPGVLDEKAGEALALVGMAGQEAKMPAALSGGMRKRVALARAIITRPCCIFYDEPTAGLDPVVSDQINHLIRRMQERLGVTQVVVTHDMRSLYHVADHVAYLREGRIYFTGTPQELRQNRDPAIRHFILGRSQESLRQDDSGTAPDDPLPAG